MDERTGTDTKRDFSGLSALVVGGSGGIGAAVSRGLVAVGAAVTIHGSDPDRTGALVDELNRTGQADEVVVRFEADTPVESSVDRLIGSRVPDIVVVGYGPFLEQPLFTTGEDRWRALFEANVMLPVSLGRRCLPAMIERGFGRFVVFGGTGTDRIAGYRGVPAYSAVKTALMSWVKSAARLTAGTGVSVIALCPGFVQTEYLDGDSVERYRRYAGSDLDSPESVAKVVLSFLDRGSALMNGAIVRLDGGRRG